MGSGGATQVRCCCEVRVCVCVCVCVCVFFQQRIQYWLIGGSNKLRWSDLIIIFFSKYWIR